MIRKLIIILELAVLLFFLFWHLKLGLVRYFDADEFAHLHWGYSFSMGEKPYTDFFYLFPPFFLYPVAAVFKIFGRSIQAILAARMFIYIIFLATCSVLFLLAKRLRGVNFAMLAVIIFAFLPLPFDKLIEVRPDLAATFFSLLGMYLFIKGGRKKYFFLSGLSYGIGLGFVPKTIFFLFPVGIVLLINYLSNFNHLGKEKKERNNWVYFGLGILAVGVLIFLIALSSGNLQLSIYSMTKMATEVTRTLGAKFYMRPDLFFYPNDTYYGFGGWSWPIIINLIIYISASIWAIFKFISSLSHTDGKKCLQEFLISASFWVNLIAFVFIYPLKHAQYLVPVAPFIAYFFTDLLKNLSVKYLYSSQNGFLKRFCKLNFSGNPSGIPFRFSSRFPFRSLATKSNPTARILLEIVNISLLIGIAVVSFQMNQRKEKWVNKPAFDKINNLMQIIPANSPVYDLTGESVFFKNGYYFCCLPYGQYEESLYFKLPDIEKDMNKRNTKYIYAGDGGRLDQISINHAKYIKENFVPDISDKTLWVRKIN